MTLYEISDDYAAVLDRLDAAETPEEQEALLAELDALDHDLEFKAEAYARIMRNKAAEAEMFKAEKERLARSQKAAENVRDRMKAGMLDTMQRLGISEINTGIGKWRIQANSWSCTVIDERDVPEEYHIPQPDKIDSRAIIDHFKQTGELIPGVEVTQGMGIRFR